MRRLGGTVMLEEDGGLSLTIARIVQRLKGSSLHTQLERQARVSPAPRPVSLSPPRCFVPGVVSLLRAVQGPPAVLPRLPGRCQSFLPVGPEDFAGKVRAAFCPSYPLR